MNTPMNPAPKKEIPYKPESIIDVVRVSGGQTKWRDVSEMKRVYDEAAKARVPEGQFVRVFSDMILTRTVGRKYYT